MNIVGVTQGSNLRIYLRLVELLAERLDVSKTGAYAADSREFFALLPTEPRLRDGSIDLVREWDITSAGVRRKPDWDVLRRWEDELGDPVLWNALMADRRIFFGPLCKLKQDYRPRFGFRQMYGIAHEAIERIDAFFRDFAPSLVLGFGTSTFGDYLFYRFARSRGIPYLQLKATKIANNVSLNDDAISLSAHVAQFIASPGLLGEVELKAARDHIAGIRARGIRYEGALKGPIPFRPVRGLIAVTRGAIRDMRNQLHPVIRRDNHVDSAALTALYTHLIQPAKAAWLAMRLRNDISSHDALKADRGFVFYPLHFEPEVSLQVFGRAFQNQIELVRNLAMSLPAGMKLVVKEHPRSTGFRPFSYYRKLLEIPNVVLADPRIPTHAVTRCASLVAVVSGSTGLEAAVLGKPVICFGTPTFAALPQDMIRTVRSMNDLGFEVRSLIASHRMDEDALERFFAAHVAGSVAVDLYSVLLGKTNRFVEGREGLSAEERQAEDMGKLADYCVLRIRQHCQLSAETE
jgi:hypothetical protein